MGHINRIMANFLKIVKNRLKYSWYLKGLVSTTKLLQIKSLFCMIAINHTILHCDKTPEKMPAIKQRESGRAQIIGTAVFQFQSLSSWDMTLQN